MPESAVPGSSLAARCTACSTVFRVVPDQLRVSEGWVRCGRCSQVFNAAENLIDLDTGAPRRLDLSGPKAEAAPAEPPVDASADVEVDNAMASTQPLYGPAGDDQRTEGDGPVPAAETPAMPDMPPADPAGFDHDAPLTSPMPGADGQARAEAEPVAVVAESEAGLQPGTEPAAAPAEPPAAAPASPLPSFVQRADRAAYWRQPRMRTALAAGAVVAALLLATQLVFTYRDLAAARWPGLRPTLEAGCQVLGCRVGPAQAIDMLTVESSGLLRVEQSQLYQLTVGLRNRAGIDLAVPALELSLTDAQGRLLSRRVLRAAELGVTQPTVAAGRDLALQATLQTAPQSTGDGGESGQGGDAVVVGYTIELFYP